jgi:hypothetical protein
MPSYLALSVSLDKKKQRAQIEVAYCDGLQLESMPLNIFFRYRHVSDHFHITKLYMTKSVAYFFKARKTTMELLL